MNKINYKLFVYLLGGISILIWLILILIADVRTFTDILKKIPQACGYSFIVFFLFEKYLWSIKPFSLLVPYPSLHGTWKGKLNSNYVFEDGTKCDPIDVTLVIKQTMLTISVEMFTGESSSQSYGGNIVKSHEGNLKHLLYTYYNDPRASVQHRSNTHQGTAKLRIIEKPELGLKGNYWTERGTTGEFDLSFYSKELFDDKVPEETTS